MGMKNTNGSRVLLRAFLLCLCAALVCASAPAEGKNLAGTGLVDLMNTEAPSGIQDCCALPDGRMVFCGFTEEGAESPENSRGRIVCLNPDWTLSWEYVNENASDYGTVAVTEDGLIAAYSYDGVTFLTFDGEPAEKETGLVYTGGQMFRIISSGVIQEMISGDLQVYTACTGWDGTERFRIEDPDFRWLGQDALSEKDGLVLCGLGPNREAVIEKFDSQGNEVWKTVLPTLSERRGTALVASFTETSGGGFLATVLEYADDEILASAVACLAPDGQLRWMEMLDASAWYVAEYGGKAAVACAGGKGSASLQCLWFDMDGNRLGSTERQIGEGELPQYVDSGNMLVSVRGLIPTGDGLWLHLSFWENGDPDPEEEEPAWSQANDALAQVPEL